MTDKTTEIQESVRPEGEVPYRFDGRYTESERAQLREFMHEDFPHITYERGRGKEIIIEYPPAEICEPAEWKKILDTVLLPELQTFHPSLRQTKTIIRFTDKLYDYQNKVDAGGNDIFMKNEDWVRVNYKASSGKNLNLQNCTLILMHELTEGDFWQKTLPDDEDAHSGQASDIDIFKKEDQTYRNLLDEKIANRRALRAVRRYWPNANWTNPDSVYEEDKP